MSPQNPYMSYNLGELVNFCNEFHFQFIYGTLIWKYFKFSYLINGTYIKREQSI
jgi:hypothetical protein